MKTPDARKNALPFLCYEMARRFKRFLLVAGKKPAVIFCVLWTGALVFFFIYSFWGASLVADIYYERSISFLNEILGGRNSHTLEFYLGVADRMVNTGLKAILFFSLAPFFFVYAKHTRGAMLNDIFSARTSPGVAVVAFALVLIVSSVPLALVTYPPLSDYPFHIARAYILSAWSGVPSLQDWYDIQSFVLPNMGMDLSLIVIGKFLPVETAGRVFIALTFGLTLSGCMFLNASVQKRLSLWPLVSSFFLFNGVLLFGFTNYLFGVSLLLWAVGFWVRATRLAVPLRFFCGTVLSTILFFSHLVTLGFYAVIVAGYELQRALETFKSSRKDAFADLVTGASIFIIPLLLFLVSATAGESSTEISYETPFIGQKIRALVTVLAGYQWIDVLQITVVALFSVVVALHGRLRIAKPMYLALTMLVVTYFLLPREALSAGLIDYRVPIVIVFIAIGSTGLELKSPGWRRATIIGMAGFLFLRSMVLSNSWQRDELVIQEYRDAFSEMASDSLLFVVTGEGSFNETIRRLGMETPVNHLGSLATMEQGVFVPAIYAHPSQQPITVTAKYGAIKAFQKHGPIRVNTAAELESVVGRIRRLTAGYCVQSRGVYLLVHDPKHALPNFVQVIASGSRFVLLEVEVC